MAEILDIVNEHDEVIGQMERAEAHKKGLIYRSVHVSFYTPSGDLILQRRSMTKSTYPGSLTTTVSGHVESGETYTATAIKETKEETGVDIDPDKLVDLGVVYYQNENTNGPGVSSMKALYAYPFDGNIIDLKVEEGEGAGFELMSIVNLHNALVEQPDEFIALFFAPAGQEMLRKIEALFFSKDH